MKIFNHEKYNLPDYFDRAIHSVSSIKLKLEFNAKRTAESILDLSDFYINNPEGKTPWENKNTLLAYLYYYLPLNFLRSYSVFQQLQTLKVFDESFLNNIISNNIKIEIDELGSGLGSASLALFLTNPKIIHSLSKINYFENSNLAINTHKDLISEIFKNNSDFIDEHKNKSNFEIQFKPINKKSTDNIFKILIASYSLTEIPNPLKILHNYDYIIILEPSTSEDGRKLLELRQKLIEEKFSIIAPCLHNDLCPLLTQSQKDWCHDRIHWQMPTWFQEIEKYLPMKNNTLTFSFLVAQKTIHLNHPQIIIEDKNKYLRVVGDTLVENGKTRQLVCADKNRLFLTWMHKIFPKNTIEETPRGSIIDYPDNFEIKANEIRLKS